MFRWLTVSQLFDSTLAEQRAVQDPQKATSPAQGVPQEEIGSGVLPEDTSSADWLSAETGTGGVKPVDKGMNPAALTTVLASLFGSGIGTFFEIRSQQNSLKAQSLSLQHEEAMSAITARNAERTAQGIIESSQREIGRYTAEAGAAKATRSATMAGRGVVLGSGSAAEVQASGELIKQADVMAIGVNAATAAADVRTRGVNARNASAFARVSASNLRRNAGNDLLPYAGFVTASTGGLARLGMQYATDRYPRLT